MGQVGQEFVGSDKFRVTFDGRREETSGSVGAGWAVEVGQKGRWKPVCRECLKLGG